jgi:hypothetical protein
MASSIDITKPASGTATTQSVRDNFSAAKTEIEALQSGKVDTVSGKGLSTEDYTSTEKTKLAGIATGATANSADATLLDRANHTGSQAISTVTGLQTALDAKQPLATVLTNTTASFTTAQETKLAGIASGATANSSDATLLNRTNHTGTQTASTISDFATTVRSTVLTGLSLASSTVISATDTLLVALGSLQKQISDLVTTVASKITASSTDTLTNKTISGASNTLSNIAQSSVTNLTTDLAAKAATASNNTFTKAQRGSITTLTFGATITPDFSANNFFELTMTGNGNLAVPTNLVAGQSGSIRIIQDATGNRTLSYTTLNGWKFAGATAPTLSTAANSVDTLHYIVWSTTFIEAYLAKGVAS